MKPLIFSAPIGDDEMSKDTLTRAADFLEQDADELTLSHTIGGEWPSDEISSEVRTRVEELHAIAARLLELDGENARLRSNLAALEAEKNTYIDYVGDALGQSDDESLWDAAQRVLSERDRLREALKAWDDAAEHTHDCSGRFHYSAPEKCDCWIKEPIRLTAEAMKENDDV